MSTEQSSVQILQGREKRARLGHPWIFSNELKMDRRAKAIAAGSLVRIEDHHGASLGLATFNPHSLISARMLARDAATRIDAAFFAARFRAAAALREKFYAEPYYRLVHAEADGLPGLIVDRYGDVFVAQANTAGMEQLTQDWLAALGECFRPRAVVLRNDASVRTLEGLPREVRLAAGALTGPVEIVEEGVRFLADPMGGQKTGWFFDLRLARSLVAGLAKGGRLLDCYCHSGAFALRAAAAGAASVIATDRSDAALALAGQAAELNGLAERVGFAAGDAFAELERRAAGSERYDIVIADPPNFVKAKKDLPAGIKGYRKLARLAAPLVAPGGFLFIASCSHHVSVEAFAEEVARGLVSAERSGRIVAAGGAAPDHPVHPLLPESAYIKWQLLQLE